MIKFDHDKLMKERFKRVNSAIAESGYSFNDLEKITGIPHSTLQRYVSGTTDKIPVTFYDAIAAATNKPVEYLLGFDKKIAPIKTNQDDLTKAILSMPEEDKERVKELADLLQLKRQIQNKSKH